MTQGFSELLPISSSGHLILVPWVADWRYLEHHADFNKTFDVALHLGTLISVVVYFWADLVIYVKAFFAAVGARAIRTDDERIAVGIAIATIPAAIAGALGESAIESRLGQPWQIAILLAVFGALLWIADQTPQQRVAARTRSRAGDPHRHLPDPRADAGHSRSGITITTGRFSGLTANAAARFSFLLLVPIVLGAVLYKGAKVAVHPLPAGSTGPFVVGTIAAAAIGLVAIDLLLGYVRNHSYAPFAIYRIVLAILIAVAILSGWRPRRSRRPGARRDGVETIRHRTGSRHFRSGRAGPTMPANGHLCRHRSPLLADEHPPRFRAVSGPGSRPSRSRRRRARPARRPADAGR